MTSILRKRKDNLGHYITVLNEGDSICVNGPATFKILATMHCGHRQKSQIVVIAEKDVKIFKNYGNSENGQD